MLPIFNTKKNKIENEKSLKIQEKAISQEEQDLRNHIKHAEEEMHNLYNKFEFATDPNLIDSYIYELKALQHKYEYLLKQVKQIQ